MTPDLSIGPIITSLITVLVVSVGGVFWFGKLSAKVDRLQVDISKLQPGWRNDTTFLYVTTLLLPLYRILNSPSARSPSSPS